MSGAARCPKCDAAVSATDAACRACGLARGRMDGYQPPAFDAPDPVVGAWQACAAAWDDDGAHERFCAAAAAAGAFGFAAQAYRGAARERPGDARAGRGLARAQRMAAAALLTRPPVAERLAAACAGRRRPYGGATALLIALLVAAAIGSIALLALHLRAEPKAREPRARRPAPASAPAPHR